MFQIAIGNAIERAQSRSSLYNSASLTAEPLKKAKLVSPKTVGKGWFDIEPLEMDDKLKKEIKMIQLRNYMDPKRYCQYFCIADSSPLAFKEADFFPHSSTTQVPISIC